MKRKTLIPAGNPEKKRHPRTDSRFPLGTKGMVRGRVRLIAAGVGLDPHVKLALNSLSCSHGSTVSPLALLEGGGPGSTPSLQAVFYFGHASALGLQALLEGDLERSEVAPELPRVHGVHPEVDCGSHVVCGLVGHLMEGRRRDGGRGTGTTCRLLHRLHFVGTDIILSLGLRGHQRKIVTGGDCDLLLWCKRD